MAIGTSTLRIIFILLIVWLIRSIVRMTIDKIEKYLIKTNQEQKTYEKETQKRIDTIIMLLQQGFSISLWFITILILLKEVGISIGPILAGAGIVGLAVGFGAQNLVKDVISGFFNLVENQIRVGDVVVINGTGGIVEKIGFRTILLRDLAGVVHIFPNGTISTLSNMTFKWSAYIIDVPISYEENIDRTIEVIKQSGNEIKNDPGLKYFILEDLEIFGVDEYAESSINIKIRIKTVPIKQWDVGRALRKKIKENFDKNNISIPYPHREVFLNDKSSNSNLKNNLPTT